MEQEPNNSLEFSWHSNLNLHQEAAYYGWVQKPEFLMAQKWLHLITLKETGSVTAMCCTALILGLEHSHGLSRTMGVMANMDI